jgi:hypothetical protein
MQTLASGYIALSFHRRDGRRGDRAHRTSPTARPHRFSRALTRPRQPAWPPGGRSPPRAVNLTGLPFCHPPDSRSPARQTGRQIPTRSRSHRPSRHLHRQRSCARWNRPSRFLIQHRTPCRKHPSTWPAATDGQKKTPTNTQMGEHAGAISVTPYQTGSRPAPVTQQ